MIHYIKTISSGEIVGSGSIQEEAFESISCRHNVSLRSVEYPVNPATHYWRGGLVPYPPKPDPFAQFDYKSGKWVSEADTEGAANEARAKRQRLLTACDWTQSADAPVNKKAWRDYRKALRDITDQDGFPFKIIWPTEPK